MPGRCPPGEAMSERDMQADWFVREVKRCAAIGMPLGCCEEWPECSHVLAWTDERAAAVRQKELNG
jgi:hypothetical protein